MIKIVQTITYQCNVCANEHTESYTIPLGADYLVPSIPRDWFEFGWTHICENHHELKILIDGSPFNDFFVKGEK